MPNRADDIQDATPLDKRVEELLTQESAAAKDAGRDGGSAHDVSLPSPPGESGGGETDGFDSIEEAMVEVSAEIERVPDAPVAEVAAAPAPRIVGAPSLDEEMLGGRGAPQSVVHKVSADAVTGGESLDEEFASPEAISRLDEKLAASATELSRGAGDVAEESRSKVVAEGTADSGPEFVGASEVDGEAPPALAKVVTAPVAAVPPAPRVEPEKTASAPAPMAPMPVAQMSAPSPAPAPTSREAARSPVLQSAPVVEQTQPVVREPRPGIGALGATALRPLAVATSRLAPGTRQTIAYAAVVTLFQAACLWGFLAFRGPPIAAEATSAPVRLLSPGDAAEPTRKAAPKKTSSKPKADAKKDANADAGGN